MLPGHPSRYAADSGVRGTSKREQSDLRRAIQAHGNGDGTHAGVGIERERTDVVSPQHVLLRHLGQVERRKQGKPDLASVRVTGKLEIDGKARDYIGVVGLVGQEDYGFG